MIYTTLFAASFLTLVAGHGALTEVKGLNGVVGTALAITDTPRTGAGARPFQRDTSVIRDRDIASGATSACGKTKESGAFDMMAMTDAVAAKNGQKLPSIRAGETIDMTIHQINQDGAGPYNCDISADGATFTRMEVTTNVPGVNSLSLATARDFPLVVRVPESMTSCAGGSNGATCIIRCRNAAIAGPFGGCAPVMMEEATATVTVPSAEVSRAASVEVVTDADADAVTKAEAEELRQFGKRALRYSSRVTDRKSDEALAKSQAEAEAEELKEFGKRGLRISNRLIDETINEPLLEVRDEAVIIVEDDEYLQRRDIVVEDDEYLP